MIKDGVSGQDVLGIKLTSKEGELVDNRLVSQGAEVVLTNEFLISREFSSANEFSVWVEQQHGQSGQSRMDIIIGYCAERDIDIEVVAPLINRVLKEQIRVEAENAHMMKPTGRLPL